jgi:transcriptional regulator with XRE-family HTH domain
MKNKGKPQNRLRELRVAQGLSQTALAARAGLGLGTVNRIERWPFPVSPKTAEKLAATLRCSVEELFPSGIKAGEVQ